MANRHTDWYIVWSPQDKDEINKNNILYFIKLLKKNSIHYSVNYEEGENQNSHLDMVVSFKSKQSKTDILKKIDSNVIHYWDQAKSGPLVIGHITDLPYRLAYSLKEDLTVPVEGITEQMNTYSEEYIENAKQHFIKTNEQREDLKKLKGKYKYIGTKNVINTIYKYMLEHKITIASQNDFIFLIKKMSLDGFYFDIKAAQKRSIYRFILANETQDIGMIQQDIDEWIMDEEEWASTYAGCYPTTTGNYLPE